MTRDLEAALREVRASLSECGEAYSAAIIQHCIARIDAALSAASGEASGMVVYAVISGDSIDLFASAPGAEFCQFGRKARGIDAEIKPMIVHRDWTYGDAASRPAPSEAPNVDHARIWLQPECCAAGSSEGRLWCRDPDPEPCGDGVPWTEYVRADLLRARIAELEKERDLAKHHWRQAQAALDSARAEGIAAERERCAKIVDDYCDRHGGEYWLDPVAAAIREAKP